MIKVQIRGNQLTLSDELRDLLTPADDDLLEVEEIEEGILLKRSIATRRRAGLADIRAAQAGVRYTGTLPRPSATEEEQRIAEALDAEKGERQMISEQG